jgi:hypothetical protein
MLAVAAQALLVLAFAATPPTRPTTATAASTASRANWRIAAAPLLRINVSSLAS